MTRVTSFALRFADALAADLASFRAELRRRLPVVPVGAFVGAADDAAAPGAWTLTHQRAEGVLVLARFARDVDATNFRDELGPLDTTVVLVPPRA